MSKTSILKKLDFSKKHLESAGLRCVGHLTANKGIIQAAIVIAACFLMSHSAHADDTGNMIWDQTSNASGDFINRLGCGLRGTLGSFVIGLGVLLVLWEYFVQKQGHMLIIAIVGILGVLILGRIIAPGFTDCDSL